MRFAHSVVQSILFGRGNTQDRIRFIYRSTRDHSFNLMKFASLYKLIMISFRRTNAGKERSLDSFVAGLVGGWVVFGERTPVNEQVSDSFSATETGICVIIDRSRD